MSDLPPPLPPGAPGLGPQPMEEPFLAADVSDDERFMAHVCYGLFALGFFNGITAVIGVFLAYTKRDRWQGTYLESHAIWLMRTFWASLAGFLGGVVLLVIGIGALIMVATSLWVIYRLVKGWVRLSERRGIDQPLLWT